MYYLISSLINACLSSLFFFEFSENFIVRMLTNTMLTVNGELVRISWTYKCIVSCLLKVYLTLCV